MEDGEEDEDEEEEEEELDGEAIVASVLGGVTRRDKLFSKYDTELKKNTLSPLPTRVHNEFYLRGVELVPRGSEEKLMMGSTTMQKRAVQQRDGGITFKRAREHSAVADRGILPLLNTHEYEKIAIPYGIPRSVVAALHEESFGTTAKTREKIQPRGVDAMWEMRTTWDWENYQEISKDVGNSQNDEGTVITDVVELAVAHVDGKHLRLAWLGAAAGGAAPSCSREVISAATDMGLDNAYTVALCKARTGVRLGTTRCAILSPNDTVVYETSSTPAADQVPKALRCVLKAPTACVTSGVAWNPNWGGEFATLDTQGHIRVFDLERPDVVAAVANMSDVISPSQANGGGEMSWLDCVYGPNSLQSIATLASTGLVMYDIRSHTRSMPILRPSKASDSKHRSEFFVSVASPSPFAFENDFPLVVATTTAIHLLDMRQPSSPLLTWPHHVPYASAHGKDRQHARIQLHFQDHCLDGDRWLDKLFARNDGTDGSKQLFGAVTVANTSTDAFTARLYHDDKIQRDNIQLVVNEDRSAAVSSCFWYMPLVRDTSGSARGTRTHAKQRLKWEGARTPIKLYSSESSRCVGGSSILGCSPSSNESIWGDLVLVTCDAQGGAWLQCFGDPTTAPTVHHHADGNFAHNDGFGRDGEFGIPMNVNRSGMSQRGITAPASEQEVLHALQKNARFEWALTPREVDEEREHRRREGAHVDDSTSPSLRAYQELNPQPRGLQNVRARKAQRRDGASSSANLILFDSQNALAVLESGPGDDDDALDHTLLLRRPLAVGELDIVEYHAEIMRNNGVAAADGTDFGSEERELLRARWYANLS